MDIIAITETSQKNIENFKSNIDIEGYETYLTPSNSNKGGTALRKDLNTQHDDYASVWVEIKQKFK